MMMNKRIRSTAVAAAIATSLLGLAGCGSDQSGADSPGVEPSMAATSAPVDGEPIVVGTICSCSGIAAASLGPAGETVEAWAEFVNTHGGINGHPVKLIREDDGADPTRALQLVKKLVEQDKVVAIVGEMSLVDGVFMDYLSQQGVPVVGGSSIIASTFRHDPNVFLSGSSKAAVYYGLIEAAKEAGANHFQSLHCIEVPSCAESVPIFEEAAEILGGIEYTGGSMSLTAPNYTDVCLKARGDDVDAIAPAAVPQAVIKVITDCSTQGYNPTKYNLSANSATALLAADPSQDGTIIAGGNANYLDASIPGVSEYLAALDAYDPEIRSGQSFPWTTITAWSGGKLFEAGAKAADLSPASTSEELKAGLRTLTNETLGGLAPPLDLSEDAGNFSPCWFLMEVKDKSFVSLNGGEPVCADDATASELAAIPNG